MFKVSIFNNKRSWSNHGLLLLCAQHGQQLDGESPLWAWSWEQLSKDKGVHGEVKSEGSHRQSLGLRKTNYIQGLLKSDEFAIQNKVQHYPKL